MEIVRIFTFANTSDTLVLQMSCSCNFSMLRFTVKKVLFLCHTEYMFPTVKYRNTVCTICCRVTNHLEIIVYIIRKQISKQEKKRKKRKEKYTDVVSLVVFLNDIV